VSTVRHPWLAPRAIGLHLTLAVVVPGFIALAWWQVDRALSGNTLSWAYAVEWPFFTGYAVVLWWKLLHDQPREQGHEPGDEVPTENEETAEDKEMTEYNQYLAALNASGRRKRW
jgi:hypothetical protein